MIITRCRTTIQWWHQIDNVFNVYLSDLGCENRCEFSVLLCAVCPLKSALSPESNENYSLHLWSDGNCFESLFRDERQNERRYKACGSNIHPHNLYCAHKVCMESNRTELKEKQGRFWLFDIRKQQLNFYCSAGGGGDDTAAAWSGWKRKRKKENVW